MRVVRSALVMACVGLLLSSCASKAKKDQETQAAIEKLNKEHQAQTLKQPQASPKTGADKGAAERADGIVAKVNDDTILLSDVEEVGGPIFQQIRGQAPKGTAEAEIKQARLMVLEQLIDRRLLEQEAQKRKMRVTDEEVETAFNNFLKQKGMTKDQAYLALAQQKIQTARFKERMRAELMVHKLIDSEIRAHVHVSDQECRDHYEKHRGEHAKAGQASIQQIVIMTRGGLPRDKREKQRQTEEIRSRILQGEDFGKMAKQFSQGPNAENGGDCGAFNEGELLPELDKAAFTLQVGEVSQVIETSVGFHIIKVLERGSGEAKAFEAVKEEIREGLEDEAFQKELKKRLESLRKSAHIDRRL
jgi:peptidyl-prolyl cis-trans isomerase SurA